MPMEGLKGYSQGASGLGDEGRNSKGGRKGDTYGFLWRVKLRVIFRFILSLRRQHDSRHDRFTPFIKREELQRSTLGYVQFFENDRTFELL